MRTNRTVVGGAYTGPAQPLSAEEQAIAAEEASAPRVPPGVGRASDFMRTKQTEGLEESGMPEKLFLGEAKDPNDTGDGPPRRFIGRQGMRERFPNDMGIGRVTPELAKKLGINLETEVPTYAHCDGYQGGGTQFLSDWMTNNPDGRVPVFQDGPNAGDPYMMKGEVLCVLPREVWNEIQGELNAEVANETDRLMHGNPDAGNEIEQTRMREENRIAVQQILSGSNTGDMPLETATQLRGADAVAREKARALWKGYTRTNSPSEADAIAMQKNYVDRALETAKASGTGRQSFAVSGFRDDKK